MGLSSHNVMVAVTITEGYRDSHGPGGGTAGDGCHVELQGAGSGDVGEGRHPSAAKLTGVGIATTSLNRHQMTAKPKAGRVGTNRSTVSRRAPMRGAGLTRRPAASSQERGARAISCQRPRNQT